MKTLFICFVITERSLSPFTVHTSTPSVYRPTLPVGQSLWFDTDLAGTPATECPDAEICPSIASDPSGDNMQKLDSTIANFNFQTEDFNTTTEWLANRYLYRKLASNPNSIVSGSIFESFYDSTATTPVGEFYEVLESMQLLYAFDSISANELNENVTSISMRMEELAVIDSQLYYYGIDSALLIQRTSLVGVIDSLAGVNLTIMNNILTQRFLDADAAGIQNASITTSFALEDSKKTVNEIYLNTIANGVMELDSVQVSELDAIAKQCPLVGGSAVFEARSLLALTQDYAYDDSLLCEVVGERFDLEDRNLTNSGFMLFPNPAKQQVNLMVPETYTGGDVVLSNYLGAVLQAKRMKTTEQIVNFDTSKLGGGMYIIVVYENGVPVYSEKLIIVH